MKPSPAWNQKENEYFRHSVPSSCWATSWAFAIYSDLKAKEMKTPFRYKDYIKPEALP